MSRANREQVAYIAEVTWGTTPSTPTGQILNCTNCSLGQTNETQVSNFIRSDTNRAGIVRTGINAGGDLGIELQYGAYDDLIAAALRATWGATIAISATTISAAAADNSFNDSGSGFGSIVVGQWVRVAGFATAANNGYFRVLTKTTGKITVAGGTLVNESASPTVTIKGALLKNGTTDKSFTIQRDLQDVSQRLIFKGQRVSTFALNLGLKAIANGSFSFLGMQGTRSGTSIWSATTAAVTTDSMNSVNDVKKVFIDDTLLSVDLTQIDFSVSTNAEALNAIGTLFATDIKTGSIGVTGTLTEYFEDGTLLDKSLAFTPFQLSFVTEDAAGNAYVWDLPQCYITGGSPSNPGIDQVITSPYNIAAVLDPTLGFTMGVTRIPA